MWFGTKSSDLSHAARVQFGDPGVVFFARTDGGIELVVIGDVVAVQAFRARLEIRRGISIADPSACKIRHDFPRLGKSEVPIELQPVGRGRDARVLQSFLGMSNDE